MPHYYITTNEPLPWYIVSDLEKCAKLLAEATAQHLSKTKRRAARAKALGAFKKVYSHTYELQFKRRPHTCPVCEHGHLDFDAIAYCIHKKMGGLHMDADEPGWRCVCGKMFASRKKLDFHLRGLKDLAAHYKDNIELSKLGFIGEQ